MSIVTLYYQSLFIINKKLMILLNIENAKKNIALWIVQPNTLKIAAPVKSQQLIVFIIIIIIPLGNSAPCNDSASPVMSWFINPINQFVISTIKHRILPLIRQLNAIERGAHPVVTIIITIIPLMTTIITVTPYCRIHHHE